MTILDPSSLETDDYGMPGWIHIFNKNVDRLNRLLLRIQALGDVNTEHLQHGAILTWNETDLEWVPRIYGKNLVAEVGQTTTTTVTTTSSSTTTTTTNSTTTTTV